MSSILNTDNINKGSAPTLHRSFFLTVNLSIYVLLYIIYNYTIYMYNKTIIYNYTNLPIILI